MNLRVEVGGEDDLAPPVDAERVRRAVLAVLRAEGVEQAELSVALLDDDAIRELNREYLGHDEPTDVISFALHEPGEPPLGDVYIGVEQAARQAGIWGVTADEEMLRLAVHGTLHVLGWDHPPGEEREDSPMFQRQETLLAQLLAAETSGS